MAYFIVQLNSKHYGDDDEMFVAFRKIFVMTNTGNLLTKVYYVSGSSPRVPGYSSAILIVAFRLALKYL